MEWDNEGEDMQFVFKLAIGKQKLGQMEIYM